MSILIRKELTSEQFVLLGGLGVAFLLLLSNYLSSNLPEARNVATGLVPDGKETPTLLQFRAPNIDRWSDIHFRRGVEDDWYVDPNSVQIIAQGGHSQQWEGEIKDQDGHSSRVSCTSGTQYPTSGGSYFEANCTVK